MRGTILLFCLLVLYCASLTQARLYPVHFEAVSVRSYIFEPFRSKGHPEVIRECGNVTKPYGQLEQIYKRDQPTDTTCIWKIRAPANHRINIISVSFDLLDSTVDTPRDYNAFPTSAIFIFDSEEVDKGHMATFYTNPKEKAGGYVNSISTKENITIKVLYVYNYDFDTQYIKIKYEFLPADKIDELLRNN